MCQNVILVRPFHTRKEMEITGSLVRADNGGWSNTSHRKRFRILFVAAAVRGRALSWRRTIPDVNIPRRLFWINESNFSAHSTFGGRLYCFRHVYGLTTRSVRCVAIDGHTRDIAQHIWAKLNLILTVVLILRPIGHWKKIIPLILIDQCNWNFVWYLFSRPKIDCRKTIKFLQLIWKFQNLAKLSRSVI